MRKGISSTIIVLCLVGLFCVLLLDITVKISPTTYSTDDKEEKYTQLLQSLKPRKLITCDRSHKAYDLCNLNHSTILDPTTTTLSVITSPSILHDQLEKIRPYPRKWQKYVMPLISELTLNTKPHIRTCKITHKSPALVFSIGGHGMNFFHDLNDVLIPLYITINSLFPDKDVILVIMDSKQRFFIKYVDFLKHFTNHPIINLDHQIVTHCFPSTTVGLIWHGPQIINPFLFPNHSPKKTIMDFHALLKSTYSSQAHTLRANDDHKPKVLHLRPRLVLLTRQGTRRILNQYEVRRAAEEVGFEVVVFAPNSQTSIHESYRVIESGHAILGVHGAGLTHEFFLRPGSLFMQVVPIGFDWLADICYGDPARRLGMETSEYYIAMHESSLVGRFGKDSIELNNPGGFVKGNWSNMHIYLDQDVKIDVVRFKKYLNKNYEKAWRFAIRESYNFI